MWDIIIDTIRAMHRAVLLDSCPDKNAYLAKSSNNGRDHTSIPRVSLS